MNILTRYKSTVCDDCVSPLDRVLGQIGIDIRQSGAHAEMREYLRLLEEEVRMTKQFLKEDEGYAKPRRH